MTCLRPLAIGRLAAVDSNGPAFSSGMFGGAKGAAPDAWWLLSCVASGDYSDIQLCGKWWLFRYSVAWQVVAIQILVCVASGGASDAVL